MKTKVWAHRGASGYAPENTLEAFLLAAEQGADGVELDVQMTKDGELVVIHDEVIDRVSDGKGHVKDHNLEELKKFHFNTLHPEYQMAVIPTLREVYECLKPTGMTINVELKTGIFWYPDLEKKVLELTKELEMEDRVIYSSFNHYSIQKILNLNPDAKTGILYGDVIVDVVDYAKRLGTGALHPALYHTYMGDFLKEYVNSELQVHVWTVNDKREIQRLMDAGVDAVITNYPDVAVTCRDR
ncbi:MAG: glycerophosphodiester phosphodiesterase [Fusicatenibacter sp.]|nr:glycerophosphodiester phosphodiesterase [Fusicatenibacter sp.]